MDEIKVTRHSYGEKTISTDVITTEKPLAIDVVFGPLHSRNHHSLSITMRSPGNDSALAVGLLFCLGIIKKASHILSIRPCPRGAHRPIDRLTIELAPELPFSPLDFSNAHPRYASCGICGSGGLLVDGHSCINADFMLSANLLYTLPACLLKSQTMFQASGGSHAAGLFDEKGQLLAAFEDVGRHNALDKLIGHLLMENLIALPSILVMSSRGSFEIIQKAAQACIPVVAVMGAVTGLAVQRAQEWGITLVGFLRDHRLTVYSHDQRIV